MKGIKLHIIFCFIPFILSFNSLGSIKNRTQVPVDSTEGDSIEFRAGGRYKASKAKRIFFGGHYRKEWYAVVKAPVFDIRREGLKVIKPGGSRQTISLRLEDSLGREFVLRSIDKDPKKALPDKWKGTFMVDLLQDQVSTAHPYAALTIPTLAEAAGVYHANPILVYIPKDSAFGEFESYLADKPAIFEERPKGSMEYADNFGNPTDVFNTEKMLEKKMKDNDNVIDERLFARTRLFDMLLGDWSRHEDQWRWGKIELNDDINIFKPIPRDRDHAFFKFKGFFPWLVSKPWGVRHLKHFDYEIKDLKGLNESARNLDRIILTGLSEQDWISIADSLRLSMTDSVIEASIRKLPPATFNISGPEIISKLKSRRENLPEVAKEYYKILAKEVNVYGSDKNERFEVNRVDDETTAISVFKISKNGEVKKSIYHRVFKKSETDEIRLFGLDGNDEFVVIGRVDKGTKVRVVGGEGADNMIDSSFVAGIGKKTKYYDTEKDSKVYFYKETIDCRSDRLKDSVHIYKHNFKYNLSGPFLYPEYNVDDGFFIGAGFVKRTFDFRKSPYSKLNKVGINFSTKTGAFNIKYYGDFRCIYKHWSLSLDLRMLGPKYVFNYFGLSNIENDSISDIDIDYYRVKSQEIIFSPLLYQEVSKHLVLGFGPLYEKVQIKRTENRFITSPEANLDSNVFESNHFVGVKLYSSLSNVKDLLYPTNGYIWNTDVKGLKEIEHSNSFLNLNSCFSVFWTPGFLDFVTLASRVGAATNFGDFYFYQANTLGGTTNLRGYRRTRFYGRSSFYNNNEVRFKVLSFRTYICPIKLGLIGFYDSGRVWVDDEDSKQWHQGYGAGLWIELMSKFIFSGTYGISKEDTNINFQLGFFF